jgi:hypothetical protein
MNRAARYFRAFMEALGIALIFMSPFIIHYMENP